MIEMKYIKIDQPIGTLYLGSLTVDEIWEISEVRRRKENPKDGIQRTLNKNRLKEISDYSETTDAIFPTPIILSGNSKYTKISNDKLYIDNTAIIKDNNFFNVVDGQHRLLGIHASPIGGLFPLPIVIILNTTVQEDAHIFSIINGNQKPVSKSLIYDLFRHADVRSLERTGHLIARELNSDKESPFYKKLKMLGTLRVNENEELQDLNFQISNVNEKFSNNIEEGLLTSIGQNIFIDDEKKILPTLSQGLFIDILLEYVSGSRKEDNNNLIKNLPLKNSNLEKHIFRPYFIKKEDDIVYFILRNYFNAIKDNFPAEWDSNDYILAKSTGYTALMMLLAYTVYPKALAMDNFSRSFFRQIISNIKLTMDPNIELKSKNFASSKAGAKSLYLFFIKNIQQDGL